jgi:hypothetical protein
MSETPQVSFWMGRPVTELSREELIECVEYCARRLAELQSPEAIHARALRRVEMFKRGERFQGAKNTISH